MIVCPLNSSECPKFVTPKPKTVFIMAPSPTNLSQEGKKVLQQISESISELKFNVIEGSKLVKQGDYYCSICHEIKSCAFGTAILPDSLPASTFGNIYLEAGLMQGFGKPVVFVISKKQDLPSDLVRTFCVSYDRQGYRNKYKKLLQNIETFPDAFYRHLAESALEAKDYEKAIWYYQEGYLISGDNKTLSRLYEVESELTDDLSIPAGYKRRLIDSTRPFHP